MERIKTNIIFLFSLLAVILAAVSCSDKEAQTALENEVKKIDTYVSALSNDGKSVVISGGSSRIIQEEGGEVVTEKGDSVYFNYAGYIFSSGLGTIFDTNMESLSSKMGIDIYNRGFNAGKVVVGKGELLKGLEAGLLGAKKGEHSYIVFPSSLGYGDNKKGIVPPMSSLIFEIWILNIVKN
ncbi:MAG: FKBP-type peptidyl-prolyl cis-trans isomerase [Bacteroidales bacterium]|nr:FKBP-type peptidyl-prolyl cis-trans isomerase [Bacteroidales bacterium]